MLQYPVAMKGAPAMHMQSVLAIPIEELAELPNTFVRTVTYNAAYAKTLLLNNQEWYNVGDIVEDAPAKHI